MQYTLYNESCSEFFFSLLTQQKDCSCECWEQGEHLRWETLLCQPYQLKVIHFFIKVFFVCVLFCTGAIEKQKLVYILNRDAAARLTISSPLEAHKANTLVYHVVGVDVGFENPMFACLEMDYEVRVQLVPTNLSL